MIVLFSFTDWLLFTYIYFNICICFFVPHTSQCKCLQKAIAQILQFAHHSKTSAIILLLEEIPHHLGCKKLFERKGFLPSTVACRGYKHFSESTNTKCSVGQTSHLEQGLG